LKRVLDIVKSHIKNPSQDLAKNVFESVAKVIMDESGMLASHEGSGLASLPRKTGKRKSTLSCAQKERPPKPLKGKGRRVPV